MKTNQLAVAKHAEEIEALLLANHSLTRVQMDAMWTYVGHKGKNAMAMMSQIKDHGKSFD